jgi:hypothetical protein
MPDILSLLLLHEDLILHKNDQIVFSYFLSIKFDQKKIIFQKLYDKT